MDRDEQFELIASYLEGRLTGEEQIRFEDSLKDEPGLNARFDQYQATQSLLEESASLLLKKKMQELEKSQVVEVKKINWFRYGAVAAIVVILISAFFWFGPNNTLNSEELITSYFETYPAGNLRGADKMENPFNQGLTAYIHENYATSISLFQEIGPQQAEYIEAQLYLGNAYLATKNYQAAISPLSNVYTSGDSRFSEAASWYLLLSYVGTKQKNEFDRLSQEILSQAQHSYKTKVEILKEKLKMEN